MGNAPGVKTDFFEWPEYATSSPLPSPTTPPLSHSQAHNALRHTWTGPSSPASPARRNVAGWTSVRPARTPRRSSTPTRSSTLSRTASRATCSSSTARLRRDRRRQHWGSSPPRARPDAISSGDSGRATRARPRRLQALPVVAGVVAGDPAGATCFIDQKVAPRDGVVAVRLGRRLSTMPTSRTPSGSRRPSPRTSPRAVPAQVPAASKFDATGRATPDVSALGEGFQVYVNGRVEPVGGTSASSPTFAAMISPINEERFKATSRCAARLHANPTPVSRPHTRTHAHVHALPTPAPLPPFAHARTPVRPDQPTGDGLQPVPVRQRRRLLRRHRGHQRRGPRPFPSPYGYAATTGWDAATGLGTPHFEKLLTAAMAATNPTVEAA